MSEKEFDFFKKFATTYEIEENRYSCLILALRDARMIAGRDSLTGLLCNDFLVNSNQFMSPNSFIGIINYLLILDMIGEVFRLKQFYSEKNNIYKALKQFSSLQSEKDIDTIVSLRNCLAHNYGLINIPKNAKEFTSKLHKFELNNTSSLDLIIYPNTVWSLDYSANPEDNSTRVSVISLQNIIEKTYSKLCLEVKQGRVECALKQGIDELKARFTIQH